MLNTTSHSATQTLNNTTNILSHEQTKVAAHNVGDLVNRYLSQSRQRNIFSTSGFGLLAEVYRRAAGDGAKDKVLDILSEYEFNHGILSEDEVQFLSSYLSEVFKHVVSSNGVSIFSSEGFIQPKEVTDFMCMIASFSKDAIVYNPFAGACSYAMSLPNNVIGEEINPTTWALGQIQLFANSASKRADISLGDSFDRIKSHEKFSAIISSPAYLRDNGHEISDIVGLLYDKLENGGKLACIIPVGLLYRTDFKTRTMRETLIQDRAISDIVMLPSNIFAGTSIPQVVIVLTKGVENDNIHFGDASGFTQLAKTANRFTIFDFERFIMAFKADIDNIQVGAMPYDGQIGIALPYNKLIESELTPALYLVPKPKIGTSLSNLVEEVPAHRGTEPPAAYYLTGSSIPAAMHRKPFVPMMVEGDMVSTAKVQTQVPENAVILAIAGGEIRSVYTEGFTGTIAYPAGFIKILKPIKGISAKYLAAILSTKIVAEQIKSQSVGVLPRLNKLNLSNILIPVHATAEEREQLVAEVISSEMSELECELKEMLDSQKREVRSTRHAIIQTLSALSSNWEQLKMFAELHEDGVKLSDTIGRINPTSVKDLMGTISYAMATIQRQIESLRFEKPDWGKEMEINPYEFINDYISKHSSPSVRMVNLGNNNVADFPYFNDETGDVKYHHTDAADVFYAPVRMVERIFNNIIANANAHGFTDDSCNNEIRFDWMSEEGGIVITIANNGCPLKEGVSGNDVLMSGFTTALNEDALDGTLHSGQGGFEIKSLMEGLGTVEIISQPEAEFPVIYKLTFEKTNFETIDLLED